MGPESWPGGCQLTAHGGVNADEDVFKALMREVKEELGDISWFLVSHEKTKPDKDGSVANRLKLVYQEKREDMYVANHWIHFNDPWIIDAIGLGPSSGRIRLMQITDLPKIDNLLNYSKKDGVPNHINAMFLDESRTLREVAMNFM